MKMLRNVLDGCHKHFAKGGKLEKLYPLYEAIDTFAYSPGEVTYGDVHVRDGLDLKRLMVTVAMALLPCILFALYNTGLQGNTVLLQTGVQSLEGWRGAIFSMLGLMPDPQSCLSNFVHGALFFIPIFLVTNIVGGFWEVLFASVRGHEVNEGFLVTGLLFPLTLPPTIPLWQVALGISFGVVFAKEVYGGTGKNFLNVALVARAFLYFAYPAQISGDAVWTSIDGHTGATALGQAALEGMNGITIAWKDAFLGFQTGSLGETSTLACLLGALLLLYTGIGSWRIMLSTFIGMAATAWLLNMVGSATNPMFAMPPHWHMVLGGFTFGAIFMATDPVTAPATFTAQWAYGILIGFMCVLVRVVNPAFPEGMMLAILFGNIFAPLFDWFVVQANIKRRELRHAK